ncbi:prepilin peptidase [Legionella oakridgensis]|uniref:Prepilin leader peptidase/N-methyltransferase n=2 Tax=Legionella oakridgensis TaxID=29423 RepID=W0BEU3_9GAMM|nr:A24 family peptidase [Legionella oakridgensis]AHE67211.1 type II secretory pathway, prepilin signal peptidase [Legionella oakridgensis ATCC 33761 = DSM 21215]ETO93175.1 type 4 prepilin peptidase 1 [Legionella oakridgensis RV-2-2007]KTD37990.1 type 4 (IV) prepilin-like protein leader peptide processing enzyme PilD [Legionella oakridgensis]STY20288.1 type 4 (IV) prepilin-like protein leader peptide processing enzyme PilD [Legionella longbeachae]
MIAELLYVYPIVIYIFLALFSLAIGSLLNVIIHRLPLMLQMEWTSQCRNLLQLPDETPSKKINLFFPRSFCPQCKNKIPFWHNIPLVSYCFLRGRCATCQQSIPFRYPFVEALCLGLSLLAVWHFGFNLTLIFALLFIWLLIVICFIDLQHQLIPDSLSLSLLWLGLIANTQTLFTSLSVAVLSAAGAYLALWLFIKLFYLLTGKIGMGQGDFKLFAAFGAWFGWVQLPFILLLSSILGALTGLIYLKATRQTRDTPIPFGPFLCLAGLIALFYGDAIIRWYLNLFILTLPPLRG